MSTHPLGIYMPELTFCCLTQDHTLNSHRFCWKKADFCSFLLLGPLGLSLSPLDIFPPLLLSLTVTPECLCFSIEQTSLPSSHHVSWACWVTCLELQWSYVRPVKKALTTSKSKGLEPYGRIFKSISINPRNFPQRRGFCGQVNLGSVVDAFLLM